MRLDCIKCSRTDIVDEIDKRDFDTRHEENIQLTEVALLIVTV